MTTGRVLITGADGYLGSRIADRYLRTTDARLLLWVRAAYEGVFQAKLDSLEACLGHPGDRVIYAWGELTSDDAFAHVDPDEVSTIVHAAAVTRFNVDEATAWRVNIEGTARVLAFAEVCPSLEGVGLLSTVYASGLRPGTIEETPLDDGYGFANHYEYSKWQAEQLLLGPFRDLPWRVLRVATVVADDEVGRVTRFNALHNTLKLWFHGLLSVLPGNEATPVYLLTGDFAARAIVEVMAYGPIQRIYHVCHRQLESLALGDLIDLASDAFNESAEFRSRRILKPLLCDADSFDALSGGMASLGGPVGQAVGSIAPFAPQLFVAKDVQNDNLVAALPGYRSPDPRRLVLNTCRHLVGSRWGKEVAARAR
jgi:nucleoside-diphosphate-sugar epimerase